MCGFGVNRVENRCSKYHLECEQNSGVTPETVVTDKITIPTSVCELAMLFGICYFWKEMLTTIDFNVWLNTKTY